MNRTPERIVRGLARELTGLALTCLLALALMASGLARAADSAKPEARLTATVVEFQVRGDLGEHTGAIIADLMMSAIANTNRFVLRDRLPLSAAAKIAKAQELGETGLLDPKTAAELGRLYQLDAVVTGGVYKLGDLITVTARLIDTKTAALLSSGQIQGQDIDTIQIKINELATMITTLPEPPKTFALTVQTDPTDANVRLLSGPPYQPGVRLAPGAYEIEVTRQGYVTHKGKVELGERDTTVKVALAKQPPPAPTQYRLTINVEPTDARVRLLGIKPVYKPGLELAPGTYTVEVSQSGYETQRLSVAISNSDVAVPVRLVKIPEPQRYRLTVQTDPTGARVRLLGIKAAYQPGVALTPGTYTVEVSQSGYQTQRATARIVDRDATVSVALVKEPEPQLYRLTVQTDPPGARVRLRGVRTTYRPGVLLSPGTYTVEVSQPGYTSQQTTARLVDGDVTLSVALAKEPEPQLYRLTVQTDPPGAQVRLRGVRTTYRPGVLLSPGTYTVEVSQAGYQSQQTTARLVDGDVTLSVALMKEPEPQQYRLTVEADPSNARVRLVNSRVFYRSGVLLAPGGYTVEVAADGYQSKRVPVRINDRDVTLPVTLEAVAVAAPPRREPPPSTPSTSTASIAPPTRSGEWRIGAVQPDGSLYGADRSEFMRVFGGYAGRTATRDALLESAMQFYRATGITLAFTVRNSASSSAELSGRAVKRERRTHESSVSLVSRGQLINSGFSVSAQ